MTRSRRPRRLPRHALAAVVSALALLALTVLLPGASARFTAVTGNPAGAWATDGVAPPTGLTAVQTCTRTPITFRGAASSTSQSPLTLSPPATTQVGDVLVAQVSYYGASTISATGDWTLLFTDTSGGLVTSAVYHKVATGTDTATFTRPESSPGDMVGGILAYGGVDRSSPVAVSARVTSAGETATLPAVTTTVKDTMVVYLLAKRVAPFPTPGGLRERWKLSSDSEGVTAADESFVGPGTTPSRSTALAGSTTEYVAQTIALRPVPPVVEASLSWTASPSTWATGYRLERSSGGTVQSTRSITPVETTSATEGPLVNGTAYSFRLWAHRGTWTSSVVTAPLTPSC
ncbi:hypothetical protein LY71_10692 [Geodermatophilus tzadiensis]|uniref:Fibronectin type-III domain-containing protein n=1 Tax=Geodermatophilus tzadiensis TaxID=1137988 RepID=A0A2T0TUD4_9ACTN|nr:hypothetical protein [Geodermatophilus tzadiensis]PRY49316.1 hypothetical protein LY71_10692 [Geodermatophilus tzadiensis]